MTGEEKTADEGVDRHIEIEEIAPLSMEKALSIIGEKTRADIILELGEARTIDPDSSNSLRFSELMDRVGAEDSGGFNYHLDKLVGTFVKKTDEGYKLRLPGQLVYQAVVAGTLTDRQTIEPFVVSDCPDCDGDLTAAYHPDHLLTVECGDCETLFDAMHFPARGLSGRSNQGMLEAAYQRRFHKLGLMRRGVCHSCGSRVDRSLQHDASISYGSASVEEMAGLETYATLACGACNTSLVGDPAVIAATTSPVIGFFADHDRDVALSNWWDGPFTVARNGVEIVETDPLSVSIPFEIDDERLTITLDSSLQVVDSTRNPC